VGGSLVVLFNFENWYLTFQEEYVLRVFNNTVLRRLFGIERLEEIGIWTKLHNKELYDLYSPVIMIK
jgi:hypothetical protein